MVPQSVLLVPHLGHIVLLAQETVAEEGQHPSHSDHLSRDLLHVVSKQNVHHLRPEGLEVCPNHCHVQLHIAMYMNTRWDLALDCRRANAGIGYGGREEVVESPEPGGEETHNETGGLVETVEVVDHHVKVESESKHLTCTRTAWEH